MPYCFSFIFLRNSAEIKPKVLLSLLELKASIQYIGRVYVFWTENLFCFVFLESVLGIKADDILGEGHLEF